MKRDYSYGWEKLYSAVRNLAGQGKQRDRLVSAVRSLTIIRAEEAKHHFPKEMQDEFIEFRKEMTSVEATGEEGTIQATVNSLDEMGVRRAVEKIISFYDTVCRYKEPFGK